MALTIRPVLTNNAIFRGKDAGGVIQATLEFVWTASGDYASGFDFSLATGAARAAGFNKIQDLLSFSCRQSGGTQRFVVGMWDTTTDKIRVFVTSTNTEVANGVTTIAAGDIVRVTLVGV